HQRNTARSWAGKSTCVSTFSNLGITGPHERTAANRSGVARPEALRRAWSLTATPFAKPQGVPPGLASLRFKLVFYRPMTDPLRLAGLLSGSGRSLQNLLDRSAGGSLPARVVLVVSNKADAYGLMRAEEAGVAAAVVAKKDFPGEAFSDRI